MGESAGKPAGGNERRDRSRPPKPFRKPLKARRYQKKLAGRIFLQPDREFLASITATDEEGRIVLARDLSKEEATRLKKLRKAARKNRRGPRLFRIAILAVVVAAVLLFNVVFKDRLIARGAKSLLENVFAAQVDLRGVRFSPVRGEISFDSLIIADADAPMRNLFEMVSGSIQMDTWQLVNRRILINELVVEGLELDTPRETSGALIGQADRSAAAEAGGQTDGSGSRAAELVDMARDALPPVSFADLGLPETLDAEEFLQRNLEGLSTPLAVGTLADSSTGFVQRWQGEIFSLREELSAAAGEVTELAATDFDAVRSVDAAFAIYDDTKALQATVAGLSTRIESSYDALLSEATDILGSARSLPDLVDDDYEALIARIPDVRGEGREFITGLVRPYLHSALGVWYERMLRAKDIYERIAEQGESRAPRRARRGGTIFDFAAFERPRFLLAEARLGVGASGSERLAATVTSLTSDPEIVMAPTMLTYLQSGRAGLLDIAASFDGRAGADVPLGAAVALSDSPLDISRGLETLGFENIRGTLSLETTLQQLDSGEIGGSLSLIASQLAVDGAYQENLLGEFIADILESAGTLDGQFEFRIPERNQVEFTSAQTNLDALVAGAVRERIDAALLAFRTELEQRVAAYLDPLILSLNEKLSGVVDLESSAEELLALARDREAAAAELEQLAQNTISSLRDQLEAEARAAIDEARAEAERRAEEARRAAEEEARRAAEDAAGSAVDTIRNRFSLPGSR